MQLASVRALKDELKQEFERAAVANAIALAAGAEKSSTSNAKGAPQERVSGGISLGVSVGERPTDFRLAVRIQEGTPAIEKFLERVTRTAAGEVDLRYTGRIHAPPPAVGPSYLLTLSRPLVPGCSVAHPLVSAGTLGGFTRDANGRIGVLSNNHVLAANDHAQRGDPTLQPGPYDGGRTGVHEVGVLESWLPFRPKGNLVDAAFSLLAESHHDFDDTYAGRRLSGLVPAQEILPGTRVWKLGRTTGLTRGEVTTIELDELPVNLGHAVVSFDAQIEIMGAGQRFSRGGDSGSFILDEENRAVALLFAGEDVPGDTALTYANPLETVLAVLGLTL